MQRTLRRQVRRAISFVKGRCDLGVKNLWPEWRAMLSPRTLKDDIFAGLTVACIAIPLSLAIALASGVSPATGLVSAIIAGVVCALFGGTPLAVSGPAAAMSVLIATQVEKFGVSGVIFIGLMCGLMQLASGVFGLGRLAKFVPVPVIAGFTAGIGAIIIIGQLPRALGLPPPAQGHIFDVIPHIGNMIHTMIPEVFVLALLSIGIMRALPKWQPSLPAPLFAVVVPTILVATMGLENVPVVGDLPRSLPLPSLPHLPTEGLMELATAAFVVYFLASVETLLSSSAVDKLTKTTRHDPNQELIGQGLGNVAVAAFGGIPITGVIARSAVNVNAGGKTRLSAIIHSITLIAGVFFLAPVLGKIPIAALAGILLSTAAKMLDWKEVKTLWKMSKEETLVYFITFAIIVLVDLIAGIQAGIAIMALICLFRMGRTNVLVNKHVAEAPIRLTLSGPLTFLSFSKIEGMQRQIDNDPCLHGVILDLSGVTTMDSSGASLLVEFVKHVRARGVDVIIKGLAKNLVNIFSGADEGGKIADLIKVAEHHIHEHIPTPRPQLVRGRLVDGVQAFKKGKAADDLFEELAQGQDPHTLFLSCVDSRVGPNTITSTDLGELLVVRNVGNIVPRYDPSQRSPEAAAIEFALCHLKVSNIVICGHSNCGAVRACREGVRREDTPHLNDWLGTIGLGHERSCEGLTHDEAGKVNVLRQIDNLLTYPQVWERYKAGTLAIYAWYYDVKTRDVLEWDQKQERFVSLRPRKEEPRFKPLPANAASTNLSN